MIGAAFFGGCAYFCITHGQPSYLAASWFVLLAISAVFYAFVTHK